MTTYPDDSAALEVDDAYAPLLRLWALRALLSTGLKQIARSSRMAPDVTRFLGLDDQFWTLALDVSTEAALHAAVAALEATNPKAPASHLSRNLARVTEHLQLSGIERDILHLTVLERLHSTFSAALSMAGELTRPAVVKLLAASLGHPAHAIRHALDDRGRLSRSALLSVDEGISFEFGNKVDLLEGFAEALTLKHDELMGLFPLNVVVSAPAKLTRADFEHLHQDLSILETYLNAACLTRQTGVNILIHGRPGTGKTELARMLATAVGALLLEIPSERPNGQPRGGKERFESYRFTQGLLKNSSQKLVLFDEVEDVFNDATRGRRGGNASGIKGWVNLLLERNSIPTFWITNDLSAIDVAYVRRFDYVLHLDAPPPRVRRRQLDRMLGQLELSEPWRETAASHPALVPAVVDRAVRVSSVVCGAQSTLSAQSVMTHVINNTLTALGSATLSADHRRAAGDYRLDWLTANCDLQRLREGLKREGAGRLCFWGPPGTGKTEFARHLACELDRPLQATRTSDILSPFVGEAERQIAAMFERARKERAVLLLDEADSFLRERSGAQRSWEVTQVNEMLTQMEDFDGVFIASTNLMDQIDEAAMRRFDTCIRFGHLQVTQAHAMFNELAQRLELTVDAACLDAIGAITTLAPGDFASVSRGARLNPPNDALELVMRLRQVCELKASHLQQRPVGFLAKF